VAFVVSLNEKRRHLTTAQRAAVAVDIANLPFGANQYTAEGAEISAPISQAGSAKIMGVSRGSVRRTPLW
jgi:hypothetical protein